MNKFGAFISFAGLLSYAVLTWADMDDSITICSIIGCLCTIPGAYCGWKIWELDESPLGLLFMSNMDILNNRFVSAFMWAIRFFFIPLIFWCIIQLIIAW